MLLELVNKGDPKNGPFFLVLNMHGTFWVVDNQVLVKLPTTLYCHVQQLAVVGMERLVRQ